MNLIKPLSTSITPRDIALFFRELSTLFSAGLAIAACCDVLIDNENRPSLIQLISSIKNDLLSGQTLSSALAKHPSHFNPLTLQLIHLGEQTGKLDMIFNMIATTLEKQLAFKLKIKQALFYPVIVLVLASLVTIAMFVFIIPRFAELFQNQHATLPRLTLIIFSLSSWLCDYFLFLMLILITIFLTLYHYRTRINVLFFPFMTQFFARMTTIRFVRELALAYAAGISLPNAISLATPTTDSLFTHHLAYITSRLKNGSSLYQAMASTHCFPPLLLHLIHIGEASASLDNMLMKAADLLESEHDRHIERLAKLAEPLIMLVLGVVIGGLVIGMYLPIFNLGNAI